MESSDSSTDDDAELPPGPPVSPVASSVSSVITIQVCSCWKRLTFTVHDVLKFIVTTLCTFNAHSGT